MCNVYLNHPFQPLLLRILNIPLPPQNPNNTMPVVWNDPEATMEERTNFLRGIKNSQGPGLVHMQNALRTPAGREVTRCVFGNRSLLEFNSLNSNQRIECYESQSPH